MQRSNPIDSITSGGFSVRVFREPDREAVVELWARVFPDDPPRNAPGPMLDRKLAVDDLVWVAEEDGGIVGIVVAGYDGVRGWIYHLAVDETRQRQGIGKALVRAAEAGLARRGCPKVNLQVRSTNDVVAAFYESLGYEIEERISMGHCLDNG